MELANRVKQVRLENQMTQEFLAGRIGVTRQTIIAVEKGRFVPSVKLALELSQALGTPLETLFWLQGPKRSK